MESELETLRIKQSSEKVGKEDEKSSLLINSREYTHLKDEIEQFRQKI